MILAACGGRGNGEKDAEGLARAESGEVSGRWGGWTGRRGDGEGGWQWGGGIWKGEMGRGAIGTGRGWQWGGGQREEEMEKGGNGEGEGEMERGQQERGGRGRGQREGGEEGARGEGISQMDMMKCLGGMRLQSFLTLFTRATPGTPASLY